MAKREIRLRGYIYMKLHALGSKSEELWYYLQTLSEIGEKEYRLINPEAPPFQPDPDIDKYRHRRYVEVTGIKKGNRIEIIRLKKVTTLSEC